MSLTNSVQFVSLGAAMLNTQCPYCQRVARVREALIGKKVICPKCRGVFRITDPAASEGYDEPPQPAHSYYDVEESRTVSPRLIAVSISGALLAASAFILLLIFAQRAGKEPRAIRPDRTGSRASEASRQRTVQSDQWSIDAKEAAVAFGVIFWVVACIVLFILHVILLIWVVIDSRNRGDDNGVLWMLVVFLFGLIGLIIYLAARRRGHLVTCDNCHNRRLSYTTACPHCGIATSGS